MSLRCANLRNDHEFINKRILSLLTRDLLRSPKAMRVYGESEQVVIPNRFKLNFLSIHFDGRQFSNR